MVKNVIVQQHQLAANRQQQGDVAGATIGWSLLSLVAPDEKIYCCFMPWKAEDQLLLEAGLLIRAEIIHPGSMLLVECLDYQPVPALALLLPRIVNHEILVFGIEPIVAMH